MTELFILIAIGLVSWRVGRRIARAHRRGAFTGLAHFLTLTIVSDVVRAHSRARERRDTRKFKKGLDDL